MKKKKTPAGVHELLGIAVGCIGMSYDDFCRCTFGEFESICRAWREMNDSRTRDSWERARTVAAICIQPHVKRRISPRQLIPLPWDKEKEIPRSEARELTAEEKRKRFEELIKVSL